MSYHTELLISHRARLYNKDIVFFTSPRSSFISLRARLYTIELVYITWSSFISQSCRLGHITQSIYIRVKHRARLYHTEHVCITKISFSSHHPELLLYHL